MDNSLVLVCCIIGGVLLIVILSLSKKKESQVSGASVSNDEASHSPVIPEMGYYINFENEIYGPFSLSELKTEYPILEDTLITTDTLNGEWYEARCFECFDGLFEASRGFRINEFGEIVRN